MSDVTMSDIYELLCDLVNELHTLNTNLQSFEWPAAGISTEPGDTTPK